METKDVLERFIERERSLAPSPGFEKGVMARIRAEEAGHRERPFERRLLWSGVVAAGIAVAVLAGVAVGESYSHGANGLVVNDVQIERLHVYTDYVDE